MKKKLQIFISSTYLDMKEERQGAVEAILKSGNIPAGMELFTAGNESQLQTIMRWIDESDIYLLLLGGRYGSIEKSSGLSYTEVEYDYAVTQGKPYFAIVITEEALQNKTKLIGKDAIETNEPGKLKDFREKVLSNISSFYSETKDIKLAIHETLQDFKERYDFSGWVSGKHVEQIESIIEENRHLRIKLDKLNEERQVVPTRDTIEPNNKISDEEGFDELEEILSNMKVKTAILTPEEGEKEYSVIDLLRVYRGGLVAGVTNRGTMGDANRLLFFNVLPKLAVHDLAENLPVEGVQYRIFMLNKRGLKFLAYLDKKAYKNT
jgi:hypothetical protein